MKRDIYSEIVANSGKITFKNLLSKFNIGKEELRKVLLDLKLEGKILQKGNKYGIFPKELSLGQVVISCSGKKYLYHEKDKITIAPDYIDDLLLNDVVAYKLNENNEAEIYSIVDRTLGKMTCEIKEVDGVKTVIPFHKNISVKLENNVLEKLYDGDIIVVNIDPDKDDNYSEYLYTIGRKDDPLIDDKSIAYNFGFDDYYDKDYMDEVYLLPDFVKQEETVDRVDFRHMTSFTMDGIDTKDMDDGVSCKMLPNGIIRIYVHISDVSHYIKPNSKIFERACEKTTSLYLNNSVFHMLHHIISNGICSLNEGKDRLTKTVIMDIDTKGNIVNYEIVRSVINSRKKMTYEDVDEILMKNKMVPGYERFEKDLYILYDAAIRLEKRYVNKNGKISFANNELSIKYNDDGTIRSVANRENSIARKIIENLMIAANESVANWFINLDVPTVYRNHEFPRLNKVNEIIEKLNQSGFDIKPLSNIENPKSIQNLLTVLSSYEEYPIISQMIVSTMQRALYSTENNGHYALGLPAYMHFTSPIRRLADLLVHTMIDLILDVKDLTPEELDEIEQGLRELCVKCSWMERQAETAESIAERRQILKMLQRSNQDVFEASVVELGSMVKIRLEGVVTSIDCHKLNKVFGYDSKRKRYYDKETGQHIKIGTKIYVKLLSVDTVNDDFNVKVLGAVRTDSKKKVLHK